MANKSDVEMVKELERRPVSDRDSSYKDVKVPKKSKTQASSKVTERRERSEAAELLARSHAVTLR